MNHSPFAVRRNNSKGEISWDKDSAYVEIQPAIRCGVARMQNSEGSEQ